MNDFISRHKLFRRGVVAWSVWLITETVHKYLERIGEVNGSDAAIITGVIGILAVAVGFLEGRGRPE